MLMFITTYSVHFEVQRVTEFTNHIKLIQINTRDVSKNVLDTSTNVTVMDGKFKAH
jgi:hypothetical protein